MQFIDASKYADIENSRRILKYSNHETSIKSLLVAKTLVWKLKVGAAA
jgi:hypothetical protein